MESVSKNLFWNPSTWEDGYFYYWICDFGHFYEVREVVSRMEEFQNYFFLDHFSPSFLG